MIACMKWALPMTMPVIRSSVAMIVGSASWQPASPVYADIPKMQRSMRPPTIICRTRQEISCHDVAVSKVYSQAVHTAEIFLFHFVLGIFIRNRRHKFSVCSKSGPSLSYTRPWSRNMCMRQITGGAQIAYPFRSSEWDSFSMHIVKKMLPPVLAIRETNSGK